MRFFQEIQSLKEELEDLRAAREAEAQNHSVETQQMLNRVTTVQQERDLLEEALKDQVQEMEQQRAEQEARMEKLQTEV